MMGSVMVEYNARWAHPKDPRGKGMLGAYAASEHIEGLGEKRRHTIIIKNILK